MKKRYRVTLEVVAEHPSEDEVIADEDMQAYILFQLDAECYMNSDNQTKNHEIIDYEIDEA